MGRGQWECRCTKIVMTKHEKLSSGKDTPDTPLQQPRWETITLCLSFVYLWIWWLARQKAYRDVTEFPLYWSLGLGLVVALLVLIFVRRSQRTLRAMREVMPAGKGRKPSS